MTPERFKSSINKANTGSFLGADIGSDHDLVLTTSKLKLKTKRFTKSPRIRFDLEKIKNPKIVEMFQDKVDGRFAALCVLDNNVDNLANGLKEMLLPTAEKVLGRQRKKIQPCVTNEVLDLCDKRRHLKQQNYTNNEVS